MAVYSAQVALSTTAAVVFAPTNGGSPASPQPTSIKNLDAAIAVYLGGVGVTSATGYKLAAGESFDFDGTVGDTMYAVAASGTPTVALLSLRH